jgi:hypothetical protein
MVTLPKPDVDPSPEQDTSETSILPGTQDAYETVPPKIRGAPTNYLRVFKDGGGIEGQYFVDVSIPPAPEVAVSGAAENLSLHAKNGTVTADVWVTGNNALKRVSMKLRSDNGHVYAKLHDVFLERELRPSLHIDLWTTFGDISLSLPRCFRGPMTILTSHERVAFSPGVEERMALLSDVKGVRVYFVGDRPRSGKWRGGNDAEDGGEDAGAGGPPEEPLDEVSVGGWHSSVRIRWDGEPELRYMNQDGWVNFCMGTARFLTTGRVKL